MKIVGKVAFILSSCATLSMTVQPTWVQASVLNTRHTSMTILNPQINLNSSSKLDTSEQPIGLAKEAKSAVLMDATTGNILFEKDSHEKLPMASITKIMTMLLIMQSIDEGKLKLSDHVKVSEYASSMGGSQIFLEPGETMTVNDMLKGIAIASANDACVAMAEHMYGTEEAFVKKMNEKAKELGMHDTHFVNCNGLPAENHYSSANDIALMSKALLKYPEITKWTSVYSDYLRKDSANPLWLVNTNKLVRFYEGADGLKTGYTGEARYCLSATAKRDGFRVIAVVMGEPKPKVRNAEVTSMLNWAFSQYTSRILYQDGQYVTSVPVKRGKLKEIKAASQEALGFITQKGSSPKVETKYEFSPLQAPIQQGQKVGMIRVFVNGTCVAQSPLIAMENVERAGFFFNFGSTLKKIVTFGAIKSDR